MLADRVRMGSGSGKDSFEFDFTDIVDSTYTGVTNTQTMNKTGRIRMELSSISSFDGHIRWYLNGDWQEAVVEDGSIWINQTLQVNKGDELYIMAYTYSSMDCTVELYDDETGELVDTFKINIRD